LFFVNPDARIHLGATSTLLASLEADSSIDAVGPRIVDANGVGQAASAGFDPSIRASLAHFLLIGRIPVVGRAFKPVQLPGSARSQQVDWVSGAAMMVRTTAFRDVGGFDPSLFLYMEDVDLCRRLRAAGYRIWYEASATVDHDLGGSQGLEQGARWYNAFHAYVAREHGARYASIVSLIASVGLAGRAVLRRGAQRRRLAYAARAAAGRIMGTHEPPEA
jgi:GT2 family glycosyltransferase